jgi:hypothetical protein
MMMIVNQGVYDGLNMYLGWQREELNIEYWWGIIETNVEG